MNQMKVEHQGYTPTYENEFQTVETRVHSVDICNRLLRRWTRHAERRPSELSRCRYDQIRT